MLAAGFYALARMVVMRCRFYRSSSTEVHLTGLLWHPAARRRHHITVLVRLLDPVAGGRPRCGVAGLQCRYSKDIRFS
jgi:hypothetical protein